MNPARFSLRTRLLLSYIAVSVVGIVVAFVVVRLTAPSFFDERVNHMANVNARGPGPMLRADEAAQVDDAMTRSLNQALALAAGVAIVIGGAASILLSRELAGRTRRLAEASTRIAAGDYAQRVPEDGPPELAEMAASFNAMAGSLASVEQRRRELIGDVAHELRSPVAVLRGYVEGLSDGVFEPGEPVWSRLAEETGRISRLVDELGELSRAESGRLELDLATLDAGAVVHEVAARLAERFERKEVSLDAVPPPSPLFVTADAERLGQVLTNLLTNALNYTEPGGSVSAAVRPDGRSVAFVVRDTGIGIAPEHLPHVFERFYRVDPSRSRASGGSGIGLTIARALAEAMHGSLEAHSEGPGQGSTFTLRLPAANHES